MADGAPLNRADGIEKEEWLERVRRACQIPPTDEELEHAWNEFMEMKAAMLDCNQNFVQ